MSDGPDVPYEPMLIFRAVVTLDVFARSAEDILPTFADSLEAYERAEIVGINVKVRPDP